MTRPGRLCLGVLAGVLTIVACQSGFDNPVDPANNPPVRGILIDDYNDGADPNLLGYCAATFDDRGAIIVKGYTSEPRDVLGGVGFSRTIQFDLSGSNKPFGGYIETLTGRNPCPSDRGLFNLKGLGYTSLTFWARSTKDRTLMEVAIKDDYDCQGYPKEIIELGRTWEKHSVPIAKLSIGARVVAPDVGCVVDIERLREISLGFAEEPFTALRGPLQDTVLVDNMAFEKVEPE